MERPYTIWSVGTEGSQLLGPIKHLCRLSDIPEASSTRMFFKSFAASYFGSTYIPKLRGLKVVGSSCTGQMLHKPTSQPEHSPRRPRPTARSEGRGCDLKGLLSCIPEKPRLRVGRLRSRPRKYYRIFWGVGWPCRAILALVGAYPFAVGF